MRQVNTNIVPSQVAGTLNSVAIPAENLFYCSAQFAGTGGASGTMKLQASNDEKPSLQNTNWTPTNWSDIPSATVTVTGNGAFLIPKTDLCYQYVRIVYTNTGTGIMSIVFKALGA